MTTPNDENAEKPAAPNGDKIPPNVALAMARAQMRVAVKFGDFSLFTHARRNLKKLGVTEAQLDLFAQREER